MSSKKRSHNFNDEENKENDNRNPFCPKKPITTTLFEQRQAQNLQTQQNRAAGRAKRRSENITPSTLINTAKIWNQNLPVGVADGRPENQGGHNVFKTRVLETTAPLVPLHPQDVAMNLVELHHQMCRPCPFIQILS